MTRMKKSDSAGLTRSQALTLIWFPSIHPMQLQPRPSTNNLYKSGWSLVPEARRLSQLVVDSFRKSSKDGVQVTGVYQPMDDPAGSSASTPDSVSRGRKQSVHVYRQGSISREIFLLWFDLGYWIGLMLLFSIFYIGKQRIFLHFLCVMFKRFKPILQLFFKAKNFCGIPYPPGLGQDLGRRQAGREARDGRGLPRPGRGRRWRERRRRQQAAVYGPAAAGGQRGGTAGQRRIDMPFHMSLPPLVYLTPVPARSGDMTTLRTAGGRASSEQQTLNGGTVRKGDASSLPSDVNVWECMRLSLPLSVIDFDKMKYLFGSWQFLLKMLLQNWNSYQNLLLQVSG